MSDEDDRADPAVAARLPLRGRRRGGGHPPRVRPLPRARRRGDGRRQRRHRRVDPAALDQHRRTAADRRPRRRPGRRHLPVPLPDRRRPGRAAAPRRPRGRRVQPEVHPPRLRRATSRPTTTGGTARATRATSRPAPAQVISGPPTRPLGRIDVEIRDDGRSGRWAGPSEDAPRRAARRTSSAVAVYVIILVAFQVFLLTVAVEAFPTDDEALAWATAAVSVVARRRRGAVPALAAPLSAPMSTTARRRVQRGGDAVPRLLRAGHGHRHRRHRRQPAGPRLARRRSCSSSPSSPSSCWPCCSSPVSSATRGRSPPTSPATPRASPSSPSSPPPTSSAAPRRSSTAGGAWRGCCGTPASPCGPCSPTPR